MLKPITKQRLSEAAMQQIRELIVSDDMKPGDRLPSERELVDKLQISRTSVREALRMLEIMGLVEVKPGKGAYIRELTSDLTIPLTSWISDHKESLQNFLEVRLALEPASAGFAALRATQKDIRKLKQKIVMFEDALARNDLVGLIQADIGFHRVIGKATKNITIQLLTDTITRLLVDTWKATLRLNRRPQKTVREHIEILEAILAREELKAKTAMETHLRNGLEDLKDLGLENPYVRNEKS